MAKYGFDDLQVEIDASEGGALTDISAYVFGINGVDIEGVLEEGHTAGDSWVEQLFTGLKRGADMTLDMFYDDATGGPDDVFAGGEGEQRTFQITYGGAKVDSGEVRIRRFVKQPRRGEVTKCQAVLAWDGAITQA